jgi:hypothetical protein
MRLMNLIGLGLWVALLVGCGRSGSSGPSAQELEAQQQKAQQEADQAERQMQKNQKK